MWKFEFGANKKNLSHGFTCVLPIMRNFPIDGISVTGGKALAVFQAPIYVGLLNTWTIAEDKLVHDFLKTKITSNSQSDRANVKRHLVAFADSCSVVDKSKTSPKSFRAFKNYLKRHKELEGFDVYLMNETPGNEITARWVKDTE